MVSVLSNLEEAHTVQQEFYAILSPELKAVTGSAKAIEEEKDKVVNQLSKLETFNKDVFNEQYKMGWNQLFEKFKESVNSIDTAVINLIQSTFTEKLTSSEGAFDLLDNFQYIKTRTKIK